MDAVTGLLIFGICVTSLLGFRQHMKRRDIQKRLNYIHSKILRMQTEHELNITRIGNMSAQIQHYKSHWEPKQKRDDHGRFQKSA